MKSVEAVTDFRRARRKGNLQKVLARFSRRTIDLLSYSEVSEHLRGIESGKKDLVEIPIDSVIGSVGRYSDFTRGFFPSRDTDEDRWARVHDAISSAEGLQPIEVYQIGDAYFVLDGHHRISIARQMGAPKIEAYVKQVRTKVPLSIEDQPDDLILKFEYVDFLEHTQLDQLRPDADLQVTKPGQYEAIEEHISVHRHDLARELGHAVSAEEAVTHWYDDVYRPVVEVIRESGILREFPGRTEADLFLWISKHRAALEDALAWDVDLAIAARDLADEFTPAPVKRASRMGKKLLDLVTPDSLEAGPPPGSWRKEHVSQLRGDRLFCDVLVPVSGQDPGWHALEQASHVAHYEGGRLRGLLVVDSEEDQQGDHARGIQAAFHQRCQQAGLEGSLVVDAGSIARRICERARWNDLVVMNLSHPPSNKPIEKLGSGFRTLIRRCPSPILAVKEQPSRLTKALLAYDGSPKAKEGLFIAAYVGGFWETSLVVVAVNEKGEEPDQILAEASSYLRSRSTNATLRSKAGNVAEMILQTAQEEAADWIIMGGYGMNPVVEVALGSAVDQVLQESEHPVLICR